VLITFLALELAWVLALVLQVLEDNQLAFLPY
jgi:hypothetical protein